MAQKLTVLFDLDGTLTIAVHDFNAIRKELGIPEGQSIIKTLESLPEKESRKQKKKLQEIEEKLALNASPAPGVKRLLETLSSQNYFLGILTLNTRENAWITLKALGFSDYFTNESVIGRKNDSIIKSEGFKIINKENKVIFFGKSYLTLNN